MMQMAGDRYIGMTFVYNVSCITKFYRKIAKLVEVAVKNYDCVSGYVVRNLGGIYIDGRYATGWIYKKKPRLNYIPKRLDGNKYEVIWREEMRGGIEHLSNIGVTTFGRRVDEIIFKSFPPKRYLNKHGVRYDEEFPYLLGQKEGPEVKIVTRYNTCYGGDKYYISLDFGTYENYFYSEDEKLNRAVEEFVVDLMREIVMATEPEYGYMDMNEYMPLERDPVCETGRLKIDYYMDYKGEVIINSYLPPLLYLSNEIINKNGGRAFNEYMENQRIRKKIWRIDRLKGGVFYHMGDVVLPAERPQRSYIDIADYLLGDRIEKIKKEIKESEKRGGVLCDY